MLEDHLPGRSVTPRDLVFALDSRCQRVLFGAGRVADLPAELEPLGLHRILLIATRSAKPAADQLAGRLGPRAVARVHAVAQHVPAADVTDTLAAVRENRVDGTVTIGGGSATGLGKAVAVRTGLPLVAVPTTYAGSETTAVYGITAEHKQTGRNARALPRLVVYDPMLTMSMPPWLTATSGLNALAHAVEALYAPGANPVSTLLAQESIRDLARALPVAVRDPDDVGARSDALYGAYLAGWCMADAGTALHHTLCHVIGGTYRIDHGALHAVLLAYVTAYNAPACPEAMRRITAALGCDDAAAGLRELAARLDAPGDLASLGLPDDALGDVTSRAIDGVGERNPRPPDARSLRRLLEDAHAGRPPGTY
jgi:maleylacetate reductase